MATKNKIVAGEVEPEQHIGVPLWVVYGHNCFPSILCCRLRDDGRDIVIWGYSVYKRKPGFRTIGQILSTWREGNAEYGKSLEKWFIKQEDAVAFINKLVTPSPKVL